MEAIIVENNISAIESLQNQISEVAPEIKILDCAKSAQDAFTIIQKKKPDLVFLDINLNGNETGIDLLERLENQKFKVIFTTAYDEYALAAFKLNACDFLLKPFTKVDLLKAIKKVKILSLGEHTASLKIVTHNHKLGLADFKKIAFMDSKGSYNILRFSEIEFFEADGSYVKVHRDNGESIDHTGASVSDFEVLLKFKGFIRINQKYLINIYHLDKLIKRGRKKTNYEMGAGGQVVLNSGIKLAVSRNYLPKIKQFLSN